MDEMIKYCRSDKSEILVSQAKTETKMAECFRLVSGVCVVHKFTDVHIQPLFRRSVFLHSEVSSSPKLHTCNGTSTFSRG